jgi:hypothetical protein
MNYEVTKADGAVAVVAADRFEIARLRWRCWLQWHFRTRWQLASARRAEAKKRALAAMAEELASGQPR